MLTTKFNEMEENDDFKEDDGLQEVARMAEETQDVSDVTEPEVAEVTEPVHDGDVDRDTLIAEAEMRGYMRGRNERIEELMRQPGKCIPEQAPEPAGHNGREILILNNMRGSVWNN